MGMATGGSNLNVSELSNLGVNEAHGAGVGGPAVQAAGRDQLNPGLAASAGAAFDAAAQLQGNANLAVQGAGSGLVAGSDNVTAVNVV